MFAHAAGSLTGLPLPAWQFAWATAAVVVVAFFLVGSAMPRPRLEAAAEGRRLPRLLSRITDVLGVVLRLVGLVVFMVVVTAGLWGNQFPAANIGPIAVYITLWVGLQVVSALLGDVWRVLSPWDTLALAGAWVRARVRHQPAGPVEADDDATHWPALAGLVGFAWLELAYHSPSSPRVIGGLALGYTVVVLAAAARHGRRWLRTGDVFAVLFGLLAASSPFFRDGEGRLRARWPFTGLSEVLVRPGTLPFLLIALGAIVFDGVSRTTFWFDVLLGHEGWGYTLINTIGMVWAMGAVALVYTAATRLLASVADTGPDELAARFAPALVPLVFAYAVAHYLSYLVFEGQGFFFVLSDPYGRGWDALGTANGTVDFRLLSAATIAWLQAVAVAYGNVGAVIVAHDRAISDYPPRAALAVQYGLLVVWVGSAVMCCLLLMG